MKKVMTIFVAALLVVFMLCTSALAISAEVADSAEISFSEVATLDPGDINGDKTINIIDLVRLKKYLVNQPLGDENPIIINTIDKCDLDEDGSIETSDLVLLRRYLLGINIFEQLDAE